MRVIAGKARSIRLVSPVGENTRPTTDRIKETLFNLIAGEVPGSVFLDIFSGSGGIGIEALSRDADKAYFIENDRNALTCIKKNLIKTNLSENAFLVGMDVFKGIHKLSEDKDLKFDIVFLDPPYAWGREKDVLSELKNAGLTKEDTIFIIEATMERSDEDLMPEAFTVARIKEYKTNKHVFLRQVE